MRYLLLLLGGLTGMLAAGCHPGGDDTPADTPRVLAAGNRNTLYVLVTGRVGGAEGFRFWQRDAAGHWHAGEDARGTPAAIAAWGDDLLVFFPSGRWGRFGLHRPIIHPAPAPAWVPAAACQDGLAADAFGTMPTGDAAVLRYANGRWSSEPELVAGIERDRAIAPQLVRFSGRLFLVWREAVQDFPGSGAPYRLRFAFRDADGAWQRPLSSRLRVASTAHVAAAEGAMICLYRKPGPDGPTPAWFLATYATADEDWHEAGPVEGADGLGPLALGADGEEFAVAVAEAGRPAVARLDVGACRLEPFAPVSAEGHAGGSAERPSWLVLVAMAVLAFLLVFLALRGARGQSAVADQAETQAGPPVAPVWRRALALAVDYLLVLGSAGVVVAAAAPSLSRAMEQVMEQILGGGPVDWDGRSVLIFLAVRISVIVVYFTLAEGLTGRTLGKALLRIEVRSVDGSPVGFRRAAVRSLLRPIDELPAFYLIGLVLIVMGARPQRLGDRAAGTLVVRTLGRRPA